MHIDHVYPVEHGGSNDEDNLQALCAGCNMRKGIQTDEEFRERYCELLPPVVAGYVPAPPIERIPQRLFSEITSRTSQLESTKARRKAVFKTPRQKIVSSSIPTGFVIGMVWFFATAFIFRGDSTVDAYISLFGAMLAGLAVAVGIVWRAKYTGRFDEEDEE